MKVIIDGIEYVPAKEVVVNADDVARTLLSQFWGEIKNDEEIYKIMDSVRICVSDCFHEDEGWDWNEFLAELARQAQRNKN